MKRDILLLSLGGLGIVYLFWKVTAIQEAGGPRTSFEYILARIFFPGRYIVKPVP